MAVDIGGEGISDTEHEPMVTMISHIMVIYLALSHHIFLFLNYKSKFYCIDFWDNNNFQ